ncbi:MAG: hypothetical protein ABWY16_10860 [Pedobacter sp.]|uniref:hypothetical protein n=1 Tax=Pedobacter sp. TaxID=1411316 RepID=UPI003394B4C4
MEKLEFSKAVDAYLSKTASSWQEFMVEDHFDSFRFGRDVLDFFHESKVNKIKKRVYDAIIKKIRETES